MLRSSINPLVELIIVEIFTLVMDTKRKLDHYYID